MKKNKGKLLIKKLYDTKDLAKAEWLYLLENRDEEIVEYAKELADKVRTTYFGKTVYLRGLIEFTNYCHRHCIYCGIRGENEKAVRYRLTKEEILACCKEGYSLGYRTFVLQGGEDTYFTDDKVEEIVHAIYNSYPDCAITLSMGERSKKAYERFYKAGAKRYLLRHETASKALYEKLHPHMSFEHRMSCLKDLKDIGYQVGAGFMVGVPGQTYSDLVEDMLFLKTFQPHMVGIGPFMPQKDTPLGHLPSGTVELTTFLLSLIRLMLPDVLLPSTTALATLHPSGRERGLQAGGNVVMPNLSPLSVRAKYALYDGKAYTGEESAQSKKDLIESIERAGFTVDLSMGNSPRILNS